MRNEMRSILILVVCSAILFICLAANATDFVRRESPGFFTFDELVELEASEKVRPPLSEKLVRITTQPFISNEAYYAGAKPIRPDIDGLGRSLRVVMWNIERGLQLDLLLLLFRDPDEFIRNSEFESAVFYKDLLDDIEVLKSADVLVLQEVDWGMKRTGYRTVAKELADALQMNWAYGVEFVEVDRMKLGTEDFPEAEPSERKQLRKEIEVDRTKYLGLHGTAILSRYPMESAKLEPFAYQGYDWFSGEKKKVSDIEKGKRTVAEKVMLEKTLREVRRGGRTMLSTTLVISDSPGGKVTIVAPHLENRCKPECRTKQMGEVVSRINSYRHPVILAGDLNTHQSDAMPTNLKREVYKRVGSAEFWANQGLKWATGLGLVYDVTTGGAKLLKNYSDPTARHIPVVSPNPESKLFELMEDMRFVDGAAFDFRGVTGRMINSNEGTLGNSNQRESKGFTSTFATERTVGPVGQFKLDWIFVKALARKPDRLSEPYRFAPHYGRTMMAVNNAPADRISDHSPISVDLPFSEPDPTSLKVPHAPAAASGSFVAESWTLPVRHKHFPIGNCKGDLKLTGSGLEYSSVDHPEHSVTWRFSDIKDVLRHSSEDLEVKLPREEGNELQRVTGNDYEFEVRRDGIPMQAFRSLAEFMRLVNES